MKRFQIQFMDTRGEWEDYFMQEFDSLNEAKVYLSGFMSRNRRFDYGGRVWDRDEEVIAYEA